MEVYNMESLTFKLRLPEKSLERHWGKWTMYTVYQNREKGDKHVKGQYV